MLSLFLRPQAVLILVTLFWGSTFVVTKDVLDTEHMPPFLYVATRYLWGSLLMTLFYPYFDKRVKSDDSLFQGIGKQAVILGFLQALGIMLQVLGQHYTDPAKSAFLTSFSLPLTAVLAWLFYHEYIRKTQVIAMVIGLFGLILLTYPGKEFSLNPGDFLTLGCAIIYALITIQTSRFSRRESAFRLATGQTLVGAVFLLLMLIVIYALPEESNWLVTLEKQELKNWVPSLLLLVKWFYMVFVCTVLTFSFQNWAMARMNTTQAAVIFALEPVFTTALAVLWFGKWPKLIATIGAVLILGALIVSEIPSSAFGEKPKDKRG